MGLGVVFLQGGNPSLGITGWFDEPSAARI